MAAKDREAANEENSSMTTELILLGIAIVLLIAMIIYVSITTLFWTRLGWFFEDIWHWLKRRRIIRRLTDHRYCSLINGPFVKDEDLTDEDIHEIMNLIHKGNPPKYEIKRKEESSKVLGQSKRSSRASKEDYLKSATALIRWHRGQKGSDTVAKEGATQQKSPQRRIKCPFPHHAT